MVVIRTIGRGALALALAACGDDLRPAIQPLAPASELCGPAPRQPAPRWWFAFDGVADRAVLSLDDYGALRRYWDAAAAWIACAEDPEIAGAATAGERGRP